MPGRYRLLGALGVVALSLVGGVSSGVGPVRSEEQSRVELVGQLGGFVTVMAIGGKHAYVATGPRLTVLDLGEPDRLSLIGASDILPIHGPFHHLAAAGDRVYGSVPGSALQVIDVSRPDRPRRIAEVPDYGGGPIAFADGHLFVAGSRKLHALDLSDPLSPRLVGTTALFSDASFLVADGHRLFVAAGGGLGLLILDVREASAPRVLRWIEGIQVLGVAASGGLVFVTDIEDRPHPADPSATIGIQTLRVLDGAADGDFAEQGRLELDAATPPSEALAALGSRAFVCVQSQVLVVDAQDPASPSIVGRLEIPPSANMGSASPRRDFAAPGRIAAAFGRLFVTFNEYRPDARHGLQSGVAVFDLDSATAPVESGAWAQAAPGNVNQLAVAAGVLLVGEVPADRVRLYDITDPVSPALLSTVETDTTVRDFAAEGGRLVMVDGGHMIRVLDISDPIQPTTLASRLLWRAWAVEVRGDLVYAFVTGPGETGDDVPQLAILRRTAEGTLEDVYRLEGAPANTFDLAWHGEHLAMVSQTAGLTLMDVRDPTRPKIVGDLETHRARAMVLDGGAAILGVQLPTPEEDRDQPNPPRHGGIQIIDISDPERPSSVATAGGLLDDYRGNVARWGVGVSNGLALLAAAEGTVRAFDVRRTSQPREVQRLRVPGVVGALATAGDYAYVAGQDAGLLVLRVAGADPDGDLPGHRVNLPALLRRR